MSFLPDLRRRRPSTGEAQQRPNDPDNQQGDGEEELVRQLFGFDLADPLRPAHLLGIPGFIRHLETKHQADFASFGAQRLCAFNELRKSNDEANGPSIASAVFAAKQKMLIVKDPLTPKDDAIILVAVLTTMYWLLLTDIPVRFTHGGDEALDRIHAEYDDPKYYPSLDETEGYPSVHQSPSVCAARAVNNGSFLMHDETTDRAFCQPSVYTRLEKNNASENVYKEIFLSY
ncbi:hypothetical protein BDV19DRAFT_395231 [Aspergillus venezuelensis]